MSRQIGLDCINLRPTPRPAHTEYSLEYHTSLIDSLAGQQMAPADRLRCLYDAWDFDFLWCTHDGFVDWAKAGRCTDMGHAVYAADGSDQREAKASPFQTPEEVWEFDPRKEYGITPYDELVARYEEDYRRRCVMFPNQVCTGGYYKTVVSGAIQAFGWEMLLLAAADEVKFARVLERFGEYSLHHARAWAQTSIDVYIQHDDMVWTAGPFLRPGFYREAIFPIYRELWKPLRAAGKKILFCSDGTWDMFMADIADCGADGFIFEPSNDFERVVKHFGGTHVIVGSKTDCRTLAFGSWEAVQAEINATLEIAKSINGFMFAVGNHIPANVSDERCRIFLDYLRAHWAR